MPLIGICASLVSLFNIQKCMQIIKNRIKIILDKCKIKNIHFHTGSKGIRNLLISADVIF